MKRSFFKSVLLAGVSLFALFRVTFSYIDPNTGGMIFQLLAVILASLTGILLIFYRYVQIFMARMRRMMRGGAPDVSEGPSAAEATDNE